MTVQKKKKGKRKKTLPSTSYSPTRLDLKKILKRWNLCKRLNEIKKKCDRCSHRFIYSIPYTAAYLQWLIDTKYISDVSIFGIDWKAPYKAFLIPGEATLMYIPFKKSEPKLFVPSMFNTSVKHILESSNDNRYGVTYLSILNPSGDGHQNVIFIDKRYKTITRIDPYGKKSLPNMKSMDADLEKLFNSVSSEIADKYTYINPNKHCKCNEGPQYKSEYARPETTKKEEDGLCVIWTIAFTQLISSEKMEPLHICEYFQTRPEKTAEFILEYTNKVLYNVENKMMADMCPLN